MFQFTVSRILVFTFQFIPILPPRTTTTLTIPPLLSNARALLMLIYVFNGVQGVPPTNLYAINTLIITACRDTH